MVNFPHVWILQHYNSAVGILEDTLHTWSIISLILEIMRSTVEGRWVVATKFSVKHQGKDIHHPPSINDL